MIFFVKTGHTFQHDHNDTINNDDQKDNVEPLACRSVGTIDDLMKGCPPTSIWFFVFQICLRFQFYDFNFVLP